MHPMSAESVAIVKTFKVGKRIVTLTIPRPVTGGVVSMACEWEPTVPERLSAREWRQYRAGRDAALAELCQMTGEKALVLEL